MADVKIYLQTKEEDTPEGKKILVKDEYLRYAIDANTPILKKEFYIIITRNIKLFAFTNTLTYIINGKSSKDEQLKNESRQVYINNIEAHGGLNPFTLADNGTGDQIGDSEIAKDEFEKIFVEATTKADKMFSTLKSSATTKPYFPSEPNSETNLPKALENLNKLKTEGNEIVQAYYKDEKNWLEQTLNFFNSSEQKIFPLCGDGIYETVDEAGKTIRVTAQGVIDVTDAFQQPDGSFFISSATGGLVTLQKITRPNFAVCYKVIRGINIIASEFADTVTVTPIPTPEENGGVGQVNAVPSSEEAAQQEARTLEASRQIFGDIDIFDQQCILLKLLDQVYSENGGSENKYENIVCVETTSITEARTITNILNGSTKFRPFINIPNHVLNTLVPRIKLFKSYVRGPEEVLKAGSKNQIDLEIPMEEFIDQKDILDNRIARGFGFGLKSFSWNNSSFNEVDRNIDANLVLKFANMDSFVQYRKGRFTALPANHNIPNLEELEKFRFIELIYQVPSIVNGTEEQKKKEQALLNRFHVKIEVGWNYDENILADLIPKREEREKLIESIRANRVVYYLFNKGHDINFEKDGSVTVTINYQSAQEARMNDEKTSNIFSNLEIAEITKITALEEKIRVAKGDLEGKTGASAETLEEKINDYNNEKLSLEAKLAQELHAEFIESLFRKRKIKLLAISSKELINLKSSLNPLQKRKKPRVRRMKAEEEKIYSSGGDAASQAELSKILEERITTKKERIFAYITLGDLLSLVTERINKGVKDKNGVDLLKVITGPYVYQEFSSEAIEKEKKSELSLMLDEKEALKVINIADIPISFNFFITWFEEEIVKKGKKNYTAKNFFSNVLNKFLVQILRPSCFGKNFTIGNFKLDLNLLNVTPIKNNTIDPITGIDKRKIIEEGARKNLRELKPFLDQSTNFQNFENLETITYIYIQMLYSKQTSMIADEDRNALEGMYHLRLGVNRGLVKEINFSRDDNKFIAPAIYAQQGAINPKVLAVPYNAEVSMVGNNVFRPGSLVFIDPTFALSGENAITTSETGMRAIQEMRLGGFYLVTGTKNSIEAGKFSTSLTCRYVAAGKTI